MLEDLVRTFPQLTDAIAAVGDHLERNLQFIRLPEGQFVCMEGQACNHLALVLNGTVRVYKSGESGREITLYRITRGGSCILTASCILNQRSFPAYALTETEVDAYLISAPTFHRWVQNHHAWQHYVFQLMSQRLESVIEVIEEVVFRRMDARLANYLLDAASDSHSTDLQATHEMIASDLGSSREVVSRLLKDFERDGLVSLRRGHIRLENTEKLRWRRKRV